MSTFVPISMTVSPPDGDVLGESTLKSLRRPLLKLQPWGALKTAVLCGLTSGVAGLFVWPARLRDSILVERRQLQHVDMLLRRSLGDAAAAPFSKSVADLSTRPFLRVLSLLCVLTAVVVFLLYFGTVPSLSQARSFAYGLWKNPTTLATESLYPFLAAIAAGYVCHWIALVMHDASISRVADEYNKIAATRGLPLAVEPSRSTPFSWILLAILGTMIGGVWAIAMALAGAAHATYFGRESTKVRNSIAASVGLLLRGQGYAVAAHVAAPPARCPRGNCLAAIPPEAGFCPRCGSAVR